MAKIDIITVKKLADHAYFIPAYQRGYRWTPQEVRDLLEDIDDFEPKEVKENEKTWYCLQPLVLKKCDDNCNSKNNLSDGTYEVIDGQQRLTTIFLIGHYINEMFRGKHKDKELSISYETRNESANFLNKLHVNNNDVVDINHENIDFYHISRAYSTIHNWFQDNQDEINQDNFISKFFNYTKVIWFETEERDSIEIFTRINIGKIPLTNSELIKAKFLNSSNFKGDDEEKIRLKQLEIATEWDRMEYMLHNSGFWFFINAKENNIEPRIEYIFNLISDKKENYDNYYTFRYFSDKFIYNTKNEIDRIWNEITRYFQTLEEWYNQRDLYHKIGFLITENENIKDLIQQSHNKAKSVFKSYVSDRIKNLIQIDQDKLEEIEYKENAKVKRILLLHNIETLLANNNETTRFPFDRYKIEKWDIEHIHAIKEYMPKSEKHQKEWLNDTLKFINNKEKGKKLKSKIELFLEGKTDNIEFVKLYDEILAYFSENGKHEDINDLSNLALLNSKINRGYGNAIFPAKRKFIIEKDKNGAFIPVCTRNVFLKYYSSDVKQIQIWNSIDRENYFADIKNKLSKYFK